MTREELHAEFASRCIGAGGDADRLNADDALALVRLAATHNIPVLGVDALRLHGGRTESRIDDIADFSAAVSIGQGCWDDAAVFIERRRAAEVAFEVVLGEALPSNGALQSDGASPRR